MATLHELETVYGSEDVYDLLEILYVDHLNDERIQEHERKRTGG